MADSTLKPLIPRGKIQWSKPSVKQNFSFPDNVIYYLAMNPSSPKGYSKLIQTCKFFFEKNPILVAKRMHGKNICSKDHDGDDDKCEFKKCYTQVDIIKIKSKMWLIGELFLTSNFDLNFNSIFCSKLYRSEIDSLHLHVQNITLDEFKLMATSAKRVDICRTKITNNDGSDVMLDKILENLPNIETFEYCYFDDIDPVVDGSTGKKITKLDNLEHLYRFQLFDAPEIFDIEDLWKFLGDHWRTNFHISFNDTISEEYKAGLDDLIDAHGFPHQIGQKRTIVLRGL